jgi:hypothetical protein
MSSTTNIASYLYYFFLIHLFDIITISILCRARDEPSSSGLKSKACREKMRRDKLNDRYSVWKIHIALGRKGAHTCIHLSSDLLFLFAGFWN